MIISLVTRLLFAAYFLEAGFVLIVAPWTTFWDRNLFVKLVPAIGPALASPFVRGAVSGVGGVTAIAGVIEFVAIVASRLRRDARPGTTLREPERGNP
jgi:hypothetical protein